LFKGSQGTSVRVACIGHLIALKVLAMDDITRPQDRSDLKNLLSIATETDIKIARDSLILITKRGFNQKKNLQLKLRQLEANYRVVPSKRIHKKMKI